MFGRTAKVTRLRWGRVNALVGVSEVRLGRAHQRSVPFGYRRRGSITRSTPRGVESDAIWLDARRAPITQWVVVVVEPRCEISLQLDGAAHQLVCIAVGAVLNAPAFAGPER